MVIQKILNKIIKIPMQNLHRNFNFGKAFILYDIPLLITMWITLLKKWKNQNLKVEKSVEKVENVKKLTFF